MRYRTKVTVRTDGKAYEPGSILPESISAVDLIFLKEKGFVVPVDASPVISDDPANDPDASPAASAGDGFNIMEPETLKSAEEIRKMRSKDEVAAYASSIGLELGDDYKARALKDLQESVVNFQDEQADGGGGE